MSNKNTIQLFACVVVMIISSGAMAGYVGKCLPYLRNGGALPQGCCAGIQDLDSAAATTPDRQQVCICLKNIAESNSGIHLDLAAGLPGKCGVSVPYKISTSTDCSKMNKWGTILWAWSSYTISKPSNAEVKVESSDLSWAYLRPNRSRPDESMIHLSQQQTIYIY